MLIHAVVKVSMMLTMFVEIEVSYSALFTFLVRWHASAVILPPGDVILAQLACLLNDIIFCIHKEYLTHLSTTLDAMTFSAPLSRLPRHELSAMTSLAFLDVYAGVVQIRRLIG
jgi:hypothetical protein